MFFIIYNYAKLCCKNEEIQYMIYSYVLSILYILVHILNLCKAYHSEIQVRISHTQ